MAVLADHLVGRHGAWLLMSRDWGQGQEPTRDNPALLCHQKGPSSQSLPVSSTTVLNGPTGKALGEEAGVPENDSSRFTARCFILILFQMNYLKC